jgi:hypothetical protein
MKDEKTRVCRWCYQPLPDWTDVWPHNPGIYLFYGYPININVDKNPRLMMITVEGYNDTFGTIYRTPRSTIKPQTGASGFFMPIVVPPDMPPKEDVEAAGVQAAEQCQKAKRIPLNYRMIRSKRK